MPCKSTTLTDGKDGDVAAEEALEVAQSVVGQSVGHHQVGAAHSQHAVHLSQQRLHVDDVVLGAQHRVEQCYSSSSNHRVEQRREAVS